VAAGAQKGLADPGEPIEIGSPHKNGPPGLACRQRKSPAQKRASTDRGLESEIPGKLARIVYTRRVGLLTEADLPSDFPVGESQSDPKKTSRICSVGVGHGRRDAPRLCLVAARIA
jgi:hypothetical protein